MFFFNLSHKQLVKANTLLFDRQLPVTACLFIRKSNTTPDDNYLIEPQEAPPLAGCSGFGSGPQEISGGCTSQEDEPQVRQLVRI